MKHIDNGHAFVIRDADAADAEAMHETGRIGMDNPWSLTAIRESLLQKLSLNLAAFDKEDKMLAYILCTVVADEMSILYLVTHPDFRRLGIAKCLVNTAIDTAKSRGATKCFLEVRSKNSAARSLYAACGFSEQSIRSRYYGNDSDDAVVMIRSA
jgi:ribosomal-protein-alanine acetyltransferase